VPFDIRLGGQAHIRKTREDALEGDRGLRPRELEAEAEMHACAEGKMRVRVARDVEIVRVLEPGRIAVCRREDKR
jgi:hypothetical protein